MVNQRKTIGNDSKQIKFNKKNDQNNLRNKYFFKSRQWMHLN